MGRDSSFGKLHPTPTSSRFSCCVSAINFINVTGNNPHPTSPPAASTTYSAAFQDEVSNQYNRSSTVWACCCCIAAERRCLYPRFQAATTTNIPRSTPATKRSRSPYPAPKGTQNKYTLARKIYIQIELTLLNRHQETTTAATFATSLALSIPKPPSASLPSMARVPHLFSPRPRRAIHHNSLSSSRASLPRTLGL